MPTETWIAGAVEALAGGDNVSVSTSAESPRQKTGRANQSKITRPMMRALPDADGQNEPISQRSRAIRNPIEAASRGTVTNSTVPPQPHSAAPVNPCNPVPDRAAEPELAGHIAHDTQVLPASQTKQSGQTPCGHQSLRAALPSSGGQIHYDPQMKSATGTLIPRIIEEWRRRQDMLRARQRLELQAQAICRRYVDGDKVEAAKLWLAVKKDPAHELRVWLQPFIMAIAPLDSAKREIEKTLTKLSKSLPVHPWAQGVLGLGDLSLAAVVGECGIGPGEYRTVSALWKRMGLAVINDGRQRRIAGAEALDHGYNAERRSLMWNIGGSLMKAQLRSTKGEDSKKVEGSEYSLGDLGRVYLDRKAYLRQRDPERSKAHVHNDAKRYMEKRLLRQLWQEWRRAIVSLDTIQTAPAADIREAA